MISYTTLCIHFTSRVRRFFNIRNAMKQSEGQKCQNSFQVNTSSKLLYISGRWTISQTMLYILNNLFMNRVEL